MGVVIGLGPMGSIKRKSSGDEVSKRDVTIVDNGCVRVVSWDLGVLGVQNNRNTKPLMAVVRVCGTRCPSAT
jgi:hypothetical protein